MIVLSTTSFFPLCGQSTSRTPASWSSAVKDGRDDLNIDLVSKYALNERIDPYCIKDVRIRSTNWVPLIPGGGCTFYSRIGQSLQRCTSMKTYFHVPKDGCRFTRIAHRLSAAAECEICSALGEVPVCLEAWRLSY
jgi:hypothetical protein